MNEIERLRAAKKEIDQKIKAAERKERYASAAGYETFDDGYFCIYVRKRTLDKSERSGYWRERHQKILDGFENDTNLIRRELNEIIKDLQTVLRNLEEKA